MSMRKEIYEWLVNNRNKFKDRKKLRDVLESKFHIDSTTAYKYILLFDFIQEKFKERVNRLLQKIEKEQDSIKALKGYDAGKFDGLEDAKILIKKAFRVIDDG